jgi:hypothetical protein
MVCSSSDHGDFTWTIHRESIYLALATDDILVCSKTCTLFQLLKQALEKLFDLTCAEGSKIKLLNLQIVQSHAGISFDQTDHVHLTILEEYFRTVPTASIPYQPFPFPILASFEKTLYESVPLLGIALALAVKCLGFSFGHIVGMLMHINVISRPDLAYCCMRFAGYMACPNIAIFEGDTLWTFWCKGHAKYLTAEFGVWGSTGYLL